VQKLIEICVDLSGKQINPTVCYVPRGRSYGRNNPWTMYFVYAPSGNFIIKGDSEAVNEYVKHNFPMCLYRYTYWKRGKSRGDYVGFGIRVVSRHKGTVELENYYFANAPKSAKWAITDTNRTKIFHYRKLPHTWLSEWTDILKVDEIPRLRRYF